jgi:hypothetical protein
LGNFTKEIKGVGESESDFHSMICHELKELEGLKGRITENFDAVQMRSPQLSQLEIYERLKTKLKSECHTCKGNKRRSNSALHSLKEIHNIKSLEEGGSVSHRKMLLDRKVDREGSNSARGVEEKSKGKILGIYFL